MRRALFFLFAFSVACGDGGSNTPDGGTNNDDSGMVITDPTIADLEREVFPSCTFSSCHSGTQPAEDLNLESPAYDKIVNVDSIQVMKPLVVPGDAEGSYLVDKLFDRSIMGDPMPQGQYPLDDFRRNLVETWVKNGAKR